MLWLGILCGALAVTVIVLLARNLLLRKAADEITEQFAAKLEDETNTVIMLSGGDRHMRRLAAGINTQLRLLNRQRHRFQQGDLELRSAVTSISHDLRTPLTVIRGYLDLLKRGELSEEVARYIYMIENRTEALIRLTEELFRYSVITQTMDDTVYENVILNHALEEALSAYYAALKECGITPEIIIPEGKVIRKLDKNALSRILGNIISNAIKYSDGDLSVILQGDGGMVFSNMAKDLNPVAVGKLFDRFFTVETGRNATGLGLSIAKLLTEQMGGEIAAEYSDGRLHITLRFPS